MSTLATPIKEARAQDVALTSDVLAVTLSDGRSVTIPLSWYPRLGHGSVAERSNWRLIGSGKGIHWPELDEDISVVSLLEGRRSRVNRKSRCGNGL